MADSNKRKERPDGNGPDKRGPKRSKVRFVVSNFQRISVGFGGPPGGIDSVVKDVYLRRIPTESMVEAVELTGAIILNVAACFPLSVLPLDPLHKSVIHSDHVTLVSFVTRVSLKIGWQHGPQGG